MRKQNIALTAFLLGTLGALVALVWGMIVAMRLPRLMDEAPRVGAGAGDTGGVNAIGEMLAGHKANTGIRAVREGAAAPREEQPATIDPATLPQGFILLVRDKPGRATPSDPIYFASNVGAWNPGDPALKLEAQSDMRWRIRLVKPVSRTNPSEPIEFKFARGDWKKVEVAADLSDIGNRRLPRLPASAIKGDEPPVIELAVERWADEREGADASPGEFHSIKVSAGTLRRLQVRGGAGAAASTTRDLLVWLPPGYDDPANASRAYPVLYLHDGQNLFEKHAGIPAEWGVGEACGRLIAEGKIEPLIVVGIPHGGTTRIEEYTPPMPHLGERPADARGLVRQLYAGRGNEHVDWVMREVMPRVERAFRVKAGPEHTGIGGSSLGGLIALYAGSRHPEVFGRVLAESPSVRMRSIDATPVFTGVDRWPARVYLGVGGRELGPESPESRAYAEAVRELEGIIAARSRATTVTRFRLEAEATHTEQAWAERLPGALEFLFPKGE